MATVKDVLLEQLRSGEYFVEKFTADLSDAEYFSPPVGGGNHAAWILGHIACSEDSITGQITGKGKRIPDATHELFKGGSVCIPDSSKYPSRKQIDELFRSSRARTIEELALFEGKKWQDPSPPGWEKSPFATIGGMWGLQGTHQFWHLGQLTVCRQAMKKKRVLM